MPAARRKLVTTHDSLGYYADRYGLEVVGALIPSLSSQAQPSSKDTAELVDQIERLGVRAIFPESSLNPKLERAVARESGAEVGEALWADTLGAEGSSGATYVDSIRSNTRAIVGGLTREAAVARAAVSRQSFDSSAGRCEHRAVKGYPRQPACRPVRLGRLRRRGGPRGCARRAPIRAAKVRLSLTGGGEPRAGEEVRYRFSVRNTGRVALESVRVSTRLPRSLEYRRGGRFRSSTRTVTFTLGRLAPGRVRSRVLVARVAESFKSGRRIELQSRVSARPVAGELAPQPAARQTLHSPCSVTSCAATEKSTRSDSLTIARSSASSSNGSTAPQLSQTMWWWCSPDGWAGS